MKQKFRIGVVETMSFGLDAGGFNYPDMLVDVQKLIEQNGIDPASVVFFIEEDLLGCPRLALFGERHGQHH